MEEWVDNKMKKLQKYFEGDKMKEIHKTSEDNAKLTLKEMKAVDKGIVSNMTSFLHGYRSNIKGFIFNEGRRISERITDNLLQAVAIALALEQARQTKLNRNTLKLSTVSHPRGLYRKTIADSADNDGISYFKMLVPIAALTALSEVGMTIAVLYMIKTQMEWDSYIDPNNNTNVVGGLGLHHGSQDYYLPIGFEELIDEKEISKQQRGELNSKGINNEDKNIYIKEIEETKEELRRGNKKLSINKVYTNLKKKQDREKIIEEFKDAPVLKKKDRKYSIIYADPPWHFWGGGWKNQTQHYKTMSMDEIKNLPVNDLADENCILFMWVTFPILQKTFEVIEAWGFEYATCGFNWVKKINLEKDGILG